MKSNIQIGDKFTYKMWQDTSNVYILSDMGKGELNLINMKSGYRLRTANLKANPHVVHGVDVQRFSDWLGLHRPNIIGIDNDFNHKTEEQILREKFSKIPYGGFFRAIVKDASTVAFAKNIKVKLDDNSFVDLHEKGITNTLFPSYLDSHIKYWESIHRVNIISMRTDDTNIMV